MQNTDGNGKNTCDDPGETPQPSTTHRQQPEHKMVRGLLPGYQWNPMRQLPRNMPCPCRSGRKFKRCCLKQMPIAVPAAVADDYRKQMAAPDLVFITHQNHGHVSAIVAQQVEAQKHVCRTWETIHGHDANGAPIAEMRCTECNALFTGGLRCVSPAGDIQ